MDDSIREPLRLFNFFSIFMTVYFLPNNYSALPIPVTLSNCPSTFLHLDVWPGQHMARLWESACTVVKNMQNVRLLLSRFVVAPFRRCWCWCCRLVLGLHLFVCLWLIVLLWLLSKVFPSSPLPVVGSSGCCCLVDLARIVCSASTPSSKISRGFSLSWANSSWYSVSPGC